MAYDNDLARRSRVARELSRQEFWKQSFNAVLSKNFCGVEDAAKAADKAMLLFDERFFDVK